MQVAARNNMTRSADGVFAADADRVKRAGLFAGRAQIEKSYADNFNGVSENDSVKDDSHPARHADQGGM
jgi:hypothetical protein